MPKKISKTTELWRDKKGLVRVVLCENEYNIEGKSNLYLEVGNPGLIIYFRILINDMIDFLNEWSSMKNNRKDL